MKRPQDPSSQFDAAINAVINTVRERHAAIAKAQHAAIMATDPVPTAFVRRVDGILGAPEEAVKYDGLIVYDYPRIHLVTQYALATLRELSPVRSGDYQRAHTVFLNDKPVAHLHDWKPGDKVIIANEMPYARPIEVGAMKMRVPGTDHVYRQASQLVRRQYGSLVGITFTFVNIYNGTAIRARRKSADKRFPALIFTEV